MKNAQIKYTILIGFFSGALGAFFVVVLALGGLAGDKNFWRTGPLTIFKTIPSQQQDVNSNGNTLTTQESSITTAVKKARPAVVSIIISRDVPIIERYFEQGPLDDFFGVPFEFQIPQYRQKGTQKQQIGGGSGFLVSSDGLIITNKHVIDQTDAEYTVFTNDGKKYTATILARDPFNDLAVIKIDGKNLPYLEFGNSDTLQVGQSVIAIGNALAEFQNTVSAGIVSGLSRSITAGDGSGKSETLENVIQTDAAINPGNSGGPLLNLEGNVIGVNVAIAQGSENIGFALPGNLAKNVVTSVQKTGKIVRPYLGVRYIQITTQVKEANKLSVNYGVLVVRGQTQEELAIIPGSPADKAGLVENDIILEVNGVKLDETYTLASIVRSKNVGDTITLKILHKGETKEISVTLAEMPG